METQTYTGHSVEIETPMRERRAAAKQIDQMRVEYRDPETRALLLECLEKIHGLLKENERSAASSVDTSTKGGLSMDTRIADMFLRQGAVMLGDAGFRFNYSPQCMDDSTRKELASIEREFCEQGQLVSPHGEIVTVQGLADRSSVKALRDVVRFRTSDAVRLIDDLAQARAILDGWQESS